jgi:hypothetical protein
MKTIKIIVAIGWGMLAFGANAQKVMNYTNNPTHNINRHNAKLVTEGQIVSEAYVSEESNNNMGSSRNYKSQASKANTAVLAGAVVPKQTLDNQQGVFSSNNYKNALFGKLKSNKAIEEATIEPAEFVSKD